MLDGLLIDDTEVNDKLQEWEHSHKMPLVSAVQGVPERAPGKVAAVVCGAGQEA